MATIFLQGMAKWARLQAPDQWGNWKINLYLDQANMQKFKDLGVKNKIGRDDDGDFITLRRPLNRVVKGKVIGMAPPVVVDKDGAPMEGVAIGNGSTVTAKCDYYEYKSPQGDPGHAVRLAGLRVDSLIPYTPEKDYPPELKKAVGKLNEQPKPQEALF